MNFSKCLRFLAVTHDIHENQVEIKDAIKIFSSLNAFQKLLLSEVLKLVKLILTVPATNAVSERLCSLPAIIFYSGTSRSSLILTTYKEKVDILKLVEVANQFFFKSEHCFSI